MKLIGEKINGTRKKVAAAIVNRDADFIRDLAKKQADAGSAWLDVNAGTKPDREPEDLVWLIETIQSVVDTPLCLDIVTAEALEAGMKIVNKTPMVNSISGEKARLDAILPIVAKHGCEVIALSMDDKKIPKTYEKRLEIVDIIMAATREAGVADDKVYIDPLVMTIATANDSAVMAAYTIRSVKSKYPEVHFTMGLSNISYGLPSRKLINRAFVTLAMEAGLDSAILDPMDKEMQSAIVATELLLGRDRHCMNYIRASRSGLFE